MDVYSPLIQKLPESIQLQQSRKVNLFGKPGLYGKKKSR